MQVAAIDKSGETDKKYTECPCRKCEHNINRFDRVDYTDPDVEIGCKAKQRCSGVRGNKLFVPVKPTDISRCGFKEK